MWPLIYGHSAEAAIAFLALASGAHDLTLPVLWATTTDAAADSAEPRLASSISPPASLARLRHFPPHCSNASSDPFMPCSMPLPGCTC